ncbi:hypothetical protein [Aphanothece hegewaldii]|nr:hypothetical protein [Aphanothece hegewaldii]
MALSLIFVTLLKYKVTSNSLKSSINTQVNTAPRENIDKYGQPLSQQINCDTEGLNKKGWKYLSDFFGSQTIPNSISTCLPKGIYSSYLNAQVNAQGKTYYSIIWERKIPSDIFDGEMEPIQQLTVILKDDIGCQVLVPPEKGLYYSKTLFMPLQISQQLALNALQRRITLVGGKEKFLEALKKSNLEDDAGTSPPLFFPEDKWAYEQLGLKVPKNAIVREIFNDQEIINEMEQ